MAYWQRKPNGHVYVYYRENGKTKTLPRSKTKYLDQSSNSNIDAWVVANFGPKRKGPKIPTPEDLKHYVDLYLDYMRSIGKSRKTVLSHKNALFETILPYFVKECEAPALDDWPRFTAKLTPWLRKNQESEDRIARCNAALRAFWNYLRDEGTVPAEAEIRIRAAKVREEPTPLQLIIKPKEVLAAKIQNPRLRLLLLMGYFFSLRPQETFAARLIDFRAGSQAEGLECCKVMRNKNLFGKLAFHVRKQRIQSGKLTDPKAYSKGWVSCFNAEAAREIVSLVKKIDAENKLGKKELKPEEELLFGKYQNDWWFELWSRDQTLSVTLKDLRRASLYYLGHYTEMDFVALKGHARHKKAETTLQYLRRPEELLEDEELVLDLEA